MKSFTRSDRIIELITEKGAVLFLEDVKRTVIEVGDNCVENGASAAQWDYIFSVIYAGIKVVKELEEAELPELDEE